MKITVTIQLPYDNEIQFFDACKAAADKLTELAEKAIHDGDHEQFRATTHNIVDVNNDDELIGTVKVSK